jgi:hypothetical protein
MNSYKKNFDDLSDGFKLLGEGREEITLNNMGAIALGLGCLFFFIISIMVLA